MSDKATEWLTKARDDLHAVELLQTFDDYPLAVAAFHCQQAVEKSLKAFLTASGVPFLHRHDLGYLLDLCLGVDTAFVTLEPMIDGLTPYAVEIRYPTDFPLQPESDDVDTFHYQAQAVYEFVQKKLEAATGSP
jgi:HEPN domain-containing protein